MNKTEAIEIIEQSKTKKAISVDSICEKGIFKVRPEWADYVPLEVVVNTIDKIGPQKVEVPQFVVEWIEEAKEEGYNLSYAMNDAITPLEVEEWLFKYAYSNEEVFAKAWLDGYEVEKEQLYTVEIPDPNVDEYSIVLGKKEGKVQIKQCWSTTWQTNCSNQLTESEIKKDFEWAWDAGFANPVEV